MFLFLSTFNFILLLFFSHAGGLPHQGLSSWALSCEVES